VNTDGRVTYAEPLWRLMLRAIEDAGRPLSSIELADAVNYVPDQVRQRRQARINQILFEANAWHGEVVRIAGYGHSDYKRTRYNLWEVTDLGRAELAKPWEPGKTTVVKAERAARVQARKDRLAALPGLAAERGWTPYTPISERVKAVHELRERGYTLDAIGSVFGLSREMIRIHLLPPEERKVRDEKHRAYMREAYVVNWKPLPGPTGALTHPEDSQAVQSGA
jgi:hypothetical protein